MYKNRILQIWTCKNLFDYMMQQKYTSESTNFDLQYIVLLHVQLSLEEKKLVITKRHTRYHL